MRAVVPAHRGVSPLAADIFREETSAARRLLAPLFGVAENSDSLIAGSVGEFQAGKKLFQIPRFISMGPTGGGDTIRLGIFAAVHGNEPEGTQAVAAFLQDLDNHPAAAKGCHVYAYPICNPAGFEAATRQNARGQDLARHFWRGSDQPEVYYLEREMGVHRFAGVISLHTNHHDTTGHFIGRTRNSLLNTALVQPALEAAHKFLLTEHRGIREETAPSRNAIRTMPADFLTRTGELNPVPFEINLEIPSMAPRVSRIQGTVSALKAILDSYRALLGTQQNI